MALIDGLTEPKFDEAVQNMRAYWVVASMVVVIQMTIEMLELRFGLPKEAAAALARSAAAVTIAETFGLSAGDARAVVEGILYGEHTLESTETLTNYAARLFELANPKRAMSLGFSFEDTDRDRWTADESVMRELRSAIDAIA